MGNRKASWTEEEDDVLREAYRRDPATYRRVVSEALPHRSRDGVEARAYKLGLRDRKDTATGRDTAGEGAIDGGRNREG